MKRIFLLITLLAFASSVYAISPGLVRIREGDGTPDGWVYEVVVDNTALSITGSVATIDLSGAAGGQAITLDIEDDGGDDSVDLGEIATSGDTNNIFTESAADKLLIDLSNNWPTADVADVAATGDSATAFFSAGTVEFARLPTVDEDNMASDSAVLLPTQQSVKAYVDGAAGVSTFAGLTDSDITGPAEHDVLAWNTTDWVDLSIGGDMTGAVNGSAFDLTIGTDVIDVDNLKDGAAPDDEDIVTYEATGTTFAYHTIAEMLENISATQGTILYRGAAAWSALATGTSGKYLKTQGAAADPVWDTPTGAGDVTTVGNCTSGDCFTDGNANDASLVFEVTDNAFETTLIAADPEQDNTVTIPDGSGSIVLGPADFAADNILIKTNYAAGSESLTQATGITVDDSDNVSGIGTLSAGATTATSFIIGSADISEAELEAIDGATVTTTEYEELAAIGATTISANQWAALGGIAETLAAAELDILDGATVVTAELNYLDITALGTGAASKAVVLDASGDYTAPAGTWDMSSVTGITLQADEIVDADVVDALTVTAQAGSTWNVADSVTALSVYTGTTSLEESTGPTDSGAYIVGVYDEFANSNSTTVQGVLNDLDGAITTGETAYDDIGDPDGNGSVSMATYTGTYTSNQSAWNGMFVSDTVATVGAATELLTLAFTDSEGAATGQLNFLQMIANSVTVVDFDEDGLKIGTGTPTNTMDGGDLYITDDVEIDGTLTLGALVMAASAAPVWTWSDSDAAGDTAAEATMRIHANMSATGDADEIGDWRIDYMHDDGIANDNASYHGSLVWLGSDHTLQMGVLAFDNQADWTAADEGGYESLKWDFNTGTNGQIAVTSPSSSTELDFQIATVVVDALTASGDITTAEDLIIGDAKYIGSTSDPDAIQIEADGDMIFTQDLDVVVALTAGTVVSDAGVGGTVGTFSTSVVTNLIDTTGAADIDIGSADVTDVTILTDGGGADLIIGSNADVDYGVKFDSDTDDLNINWDEANSEVEIDAPNYRFGANADEDIVFIMDSDTTDLTITWDEAQGTVEYSHPIYAPIKSSAHGAGYTVGTNNAQEAYGHLFLNSAAGAITFTLPTAVAGMSACFAQEQGDTGAITVQPAAGDYIVYEGARSDTAADYWVSGATATAKLCIVAHDATDWYVTGHGGTWTEE